jgi:hypothetical protein
MNRSAVVTFFSAGLLLAACGAAAPTAAPTPGGGTPTGGTPGATATPAATVAGTPQVTAPPVGGGNECAPFPTMNPASFALPSLAPDPQIEAIFPAQIDGQPVTKVQSASWLQTICFYSGQAEVDRLKARTGGLVLANLTYGSAKATVADEEVDLSAFRIAGADGNALIQNISAVVAGLFGSTPEPFTTSQTTIGGKPAWVITDSTGDVSYAYVKGDVVVSVSDVSEEVAATVFAALP